MTYRFVRILILGAALSTAGCGTAIPAQQSVDIPAATSATTHRTSPTDAAATAPTLGLKFEPDVTGYGEVQPSEINGNGDPTSIVINIHWSSWGGETAQGTGTTTYVAPNQDTAGGSQETALVVAFDLGTCGGHPAYQKVSWYFPQHGESPPSNDSSMNACTGP